MVSFESPLAKFTRAEKQCGTLIKDLSSLSDLKSYAITKDIDNSTGNQIYRFVNVPPIPEDLGLRIGEMLYNFRCSLDHLVWQWILSERNIPTVRNEFPIYNDISRYNREKGSKLKGVPDTIIPVIDSLQPCNSTGDDDFWKYLWYLHQLCNADKHRYLLLTRRSLGKKVGLIWTSTNMPKIWYFNTVVENGAIFLRMEPNMGVQVRPTIDILFSNAPSDIREDLPVQNIIDLIRMSVWEVFRRFHIQ